MFPTTIWTRIGSAGDRDPDALEDFASAYRPAVLPFIRGRGYRGALADDLCQEVFLRVLRGGVLAKADRQRGRFRSLLLTVTRHVLADHGRRQREMPAADLEPPDRDPEFDHAWALRLTERALERLRERRSPYYDVLVGHLAGRRQDRNRLWHARRQLAGLVRGEVVRTCATPREADEELRYLARFLSSGGKS